MIDVSNFPPLITPSPIVNQPAHYLTARITEGDLNLERQAIERIRQEVTGNPSKLPFSGQVNRLV